MFEPDLRILPPSQRALWPELAELPSSFVLYGGTAIALRLGHRVSVDFDFFSPDPLDLRSLGRRARFLQGAAVLQEAPDALTVSVDRGGPVKVSLFGSIGFGRVGDPEQTADRVLRAASLLDVGATKVKVVLQRIASRDYLDVAALLRAGVHLAEMLRAARALFGEAFNSVQAQKTLAFFEGGDLDRLDEDTRRLLEREALRDLDLPPMAKLSDRLD